jgi:hypothetical protein
LPGLLHTSSIQKYYHRENKYAVKFSCDPTTVGQAFRPKRGQVTEDWSKLYSEKLNNWAHHQILLGDQIKDEMGGACRKYWGEAHTRVWRQHLKERDHLEDLCVDGRIMLKWILNKLGRHELD